MYVHALFIEKIRFQKLKRKLHVDRMLQAFAGTRVGCLQDVTLSRGHQPSREGGDIGLLITLVPKVF